MSFNLFFQIENLQVRQMLVNWTDISEILNSSKKLDFIQIIIRELKSGTILRHQKVRFLHVCIKKVTNKESQRVNQW